ncbi:MAG: MmcQ/YjbR family DNA-binding protein [Pseudomonadota bacterium]
MNVTEVKQYCAALAGAHQTQHDAPSNVLVYKVGHKNFAYFKTSTPEQWRFSIRVTPERFLELTDQEGIKPARYMHRFHWVTIVNVKAIDAGYLRELIDWSYAKALSGLSKTRQHDINS